MKRFFLSILCVCSLMCGCKKELDPTDGTPVGKISVSISDVRTKRTSVTLTLRAQGVSLSDYESWGVTFSETSDKELWTAAYEEGDLKNLPAYLDETALLLKEAQELNFKRWKILDQKVHMNFQALGTYDAEVGFVRKCIEDRLVLFDRLVKEL